MKGLQHTDRVEAYAQYYPTADRVFMEANANSTEIIAQVPELNMVKPYFLSHFPFRGKNYVCSSTFQVFDADSFPYVGVLMRDTVSGDLAAYRTSGKHYLPVHKSVTENDYESVSWVGKHAFLIVDGDDWGVTSNPGPANAIVIGRFVERYQFRPNGIKWGDRFVKVELDPALASANNPITVTPNASGSCCFGECIVTAYPRVKNGKGKIVTLAANAFSVNPIYSISHVEWNWTGNTETVTVNGQTVDKLVADGKGKDTQTIIFDSYGTKTVTLTVYLEKDGNCGCGCGDNACCIKKEFTIDVQPTSAMVCFDTVGNEMPKTYKLFYAYTDSDAGALDYVAGINIAGQLYEFPSPIKMIDTGIIENAIKDVFTSIDATVTSVSVDYSQVSNDGETAVLAVNIIGIDRTLDSLAVTIDSSSQVAPFELV